ncbi:hypothetical protein K3495_g4158 [Podosphaera aphanis]|nr:hypothetical protein K3495_g4158 [Podosphaera aphanis]
MDQPKRANAAQMAKRTIKSIKSKHPRRPGAVIQKDPSTTQWNPPTSAPTSDGGLFGGSIQASGAFNFAAPSSLKLNPPPLTFGVNSNTSTDVTESENGRVEENGRFLGDDRNLKRAFGHSAGPVAKAQFQFQNSFSSGPSFGSTIAPNTSGEPASSHEPGVFGGLGNTFTNPIFNFGSSAPFPPKSDGASNSIFNSNSTENENKLGKNIFSLNQESTKTSSTPSFQFNPPAPPVQPGTSPFAFGQVSASIQPQSSNNIFGTSSTTLGSTGSNTSIFPEISKKSDSAEIGSKVEKNIFNINQESTQTSSTPSFQFNSSASLVQPGTSLFTFGQISAPVPTQPSNNIFGTSSATSAISGSTGSTSSLFPEISKNSTNSSTLFPFANLKPNTSFHSNTTPTTLNVSNTTSNNLSENNIKATDLNLSASQPTHISQFHSSQSVLDNQLSQQDESQDLMKVDRESAGYPGENMSSGAIIPFENLDSTEHQATIQSKLNGLTPNIFAQANLPTTTSSSFIGYNSSPLHQATPTSKSSEMPPLNNHLVSEEAPHPPKAQEKENTASASKKEVNGAEATKCDRASSKKTPKEVLFKRLAVASQIKDETIVDKLPPGLDEKGRKQFFAAFRIRALNQAMGKLFVELQVTADPQIALDFYTEERRLILSEFPEPSGKTKRKADPDEADERSNSKKRKQNESTSHSRSPDMKSSKHSTKRKFTEDEDEDQGTQGLKKRSKNIDTTASQPESSGMHSFEKSVNSPISETLSPLPTASQSTDQSSIHEKPGSGAPNSTEKAKQTADKNLDQGTPISHLRESNTSSKFRSILENTSTTSPIASTSKSHHIEDSNSCAKLPAPSPLKSSNEVSLSSPASTGINKTENGEDMFSKSANTGFIPSSGFIPSLKKAEDVSVAQPDTLQFKAQFDSQAKDAETRQMEKDKLEEMDSDEDEAEWEANWRAKRLAKAKEIENMAKSKQVSFVPGKGFVMEDAETSTNSESLKNSGPKLNPALSSFSDQTWKPDKPIRFGAPTSTNTPIKGISSSISNSPTKSSNVFGSSQGANKFPNSNPKVSGNDFQSSPVKDVPVQSLFVEKPETPLAPAFSKPSFSGSFSGVFEKKPESPFTSALSKPSFSGSFGSFGTVKPASTSTGNIFGQPSEKPASTSTGSIFGQPSAMSSFTSTAASSQSTFIGKEEKTDNHPENNDDQDGEKHEQIDLTAIGPGEENEEVIHEVRVKALKLTPKDENNSSTQWQAKGVGPLRVLKHNVSGASRLLIRADPSGKIILNKMILANVKYESTDKKVKLLSASDTGKGLETWILQVKTEEFATKLASVLEEHKPSVTAG